MRGLLHGMCLAAVLVCYGCIPLPIITADRPAEIAPHLATELTTASVDLMVVPIITGCPLLTLEEPIFAKASEIVGFEQKLERSSLHTAILFWPGGLAAGTVCAHKVLEICLIGSNGKTMTLFRTDKDWLPSEVADVDPTWRNQFVALLTEGTALTIPVDVESRVPCKSWM